MSHTLLKALSNARLRALSLACLMSACDSTQVLTCGEIPQDGCPSGRGGTCEDPFCAALFDCVEGDWTLVETCEEFGGGGTGAGAGDPIGGAGAAGGGCVFEFDHEGEAGNCEPDLQEPDCPAAAAENTCNPCATGCIEFFLCTDFGWENVGYCSEEGDFENTQGLR